MAVAPTYEFEGSLLRVATRELVRRAEGQTTVLPARVFDCVLYLIEQRDRAVDRDELVAVIWNRPEVGDNVLAQLMARTRKILADNGEEQRIIRTIPGFGYQWIAPTHVQDIAPTKRASNSNADRPASGSDDPVLDPSPAQPESVVRGEHLPKATKRGIGWLIALAVAVWAVVGFAFWLAAADRRQPAAISESGRTDVLPLSDRQTLVLPSIVASASGEEWLRLGVMALVGERLTLGGLPTVPSDNVVALTRGMDIAMLDSAGYSSLADAAVANMVLKTDVTEINDGWRVSLSIVHGNAPVRLKVSAEKDQVLDAAREAVDRLLEAMGVGRGDDAGVEDSDLALIVKRAESEYLGGKPEVARQILADASSNQKDSAELAYRLARMEFVTGRLEDARARLEALVSGKFVEEDPIRASRAFNVLAEVAYQQRKFADVARYSQQAIDMLQGLPEGNAELAQAWGEQAMLAGAEGRYEESLAGSARARVLMASTGNWLGVARNDGRTGITLNRAGRLHESVPVLERAAERLQQFHESWPEAVVRSHIVATHLLLGEPALGLAQEPRFDQLDQRIDHPGMRASMKLGRAEMLLANGRLSDARPLIAQAYDQILAKNDRLNLYFAHAVAARLALEDGELRRAEVEAREAIGALADPEEDERHVAWTHLILIRCQVAHDVDTAQRTRDAFSNRLGAGNPRNARLYLHLADAALASVRGNSSQVDAAFSRALALADAAPIDLIRTAQGYVPWLLRGGERDRAAEIVGRLGDLSQRNYDAALLEARLYQATNQRAAWQGALDRAQSLAGERLIPSDVHTAPFPLVGSLPQALP